jgi:RNA 2',3'-cyclic 3'-phosphodiesterase
VRLFVAVNLPDSTRQAAHAAAAALRKAAPSVRWVLPETLHITLKFLGEVSEARLAEMKAALDEMSAAVESGFTFALRGAGAFPNFRRPRVFWLGVENGEGLIRVQSSVEGIFAPLGFPTEAGEFHPHLTLGRAGPPLSPAEQAAAERAARSLQYHDVVTVRSIELMQSRLSPKGARYEAVHSAELA